MKNTVFEAFTTDSSKFPGTISIMPSKNHHEVHTGDEGLYLFAKFILPCAKATVIPTAFNTDVLISK